MKYDIVVAMVSYLDEDEMTVINGMMDSGATLDDVGTYLNTLLSNERKAEIIDRLLPEYPEIENLLEKATHYLDAYPPNVQKEMEYVDYIDDLDEREQLYIKQFYNEFYNKGFYKIPEDERILNTESMLKEARRINNSLDRDCLGGSINLDYINSAQATPEGEETWEDIFKTLGYMPALNAILEASLIEVNHKQIDNKTVLVRFYVKMERLRKMNQRDIKNRKVQHEKV